jgi:diacylglycerol kinase family enzyme
MIGVIVNPNAHGVIRDPGVRERLREVLGSDGEVVETRAPDELEATIDRFARMGCDLVANCGGDGTNLSTLTALTRRHGADAMPRFAILRGGTVNTVAENLGIRGRPEQILARIVARRRARQPPIEAGQDLLEVNGMHGFLFAAAMGARFLEAYYGGPVLGAAWASALAVRTIASSLVRGSFARWLFDPIAVELDADGERLPIRGVRLLLASVIPSVGIGMKVTWRGGTRPNRFHLVASAISTTKMALQLDRVLAGRPLDGAPHVDRLAERVDVRFSTAETFTLDGELFREREVRIRVGPRIWVVKP